MLCLRKFGSVISETRARFLLAVFGSCAAIYLAGAQAGAVRLFSKAFPDLPESRSLRKLPFTDRVAYQRAIEEVYWRHRIWPKDNSEPKPSLDELMPSAPIEKKVEEYLRNSQEMEEHWHTPITSWQLQSEMERMAHDTKQPEVLREVFAALGNDPFVIAECLARPMLAERFVTKMQEDQWHGKASTLIENSANRMNVSAIGRLNDSLSWPKRTGSPDYDVRARLKSEYTLPVISEQVNECANDSWTATSTTNAPAGRIVHTAVWTGSEMIVWGGHADDGSGIFNTGGRYNPSTDSWTATTLTNAPAARHDHSAVWTGSEMIVWGGSFPIDGNPNPLNSGGRYNPATDTWIATSTTNAPSARENQAAVWTGSEMIVWGGYSADRAFVNTGGRYNPSTNSWVATNTTNAPAGRGGPAVWTGSEMIIGAGNGGRYNPGADSWNGISVRDAPRSGETAIWTGSEMIVWGGVAGPPCVEPGANLSNAGGRYDPTTNSWTPISATPFEGRDFHTAVWTGNEMIVWGGESSGFFFVGGIKYNPDSDSWTSVSTANAPPLRTLHTAVWTGSEMIIWGGIGNVGTVRNTGGRYCAHVSPSPTPTPLPTYPSTIQFSATTYNVSETDPQANLTIVRSGETSMPATVSFDTSDDAGAQKCNVSNRAASSRCNYITASRTVSFAPGETSKTIPIFIIDNSYAEGNKTFSVNLSSPTGGALGARPTAWVTIIDNDAANGPNPIDQTDFFVREQYLDFLNREPDAAGRSFWTNQIAACGADQSCIELKRINVSAAFFLSIEFQQTGYLIERLYKAAYGDGPADSSACVFYGGFPNVRLNEFFRDSQEIGHGVVVGQSGWEALLENNKQAFANEFVRRSRFKTAYPISMNPTQFVDKLNGNAGNVLSASERDAAIALFANAADTGNVTARALALRQVAENQKLYNAEFNRAFVLMQYFSYLRRNPTDPPDQYDNGYHFWLTKLNAFNGDFQKAEMVRAFITSGEYRNRFGG